MIVAIASASNATNVTFRTRPAVRPRQRSSSSPKVTLTGDVLTHPTDTRTAGPWTYPRRTDAGSDTHLSEVRDRDACRVQLLRKMRGPSPRASARRGRDKTGHGAFRRHLGIHRARGAP